MLQHTLVRHDVSNLSFLSSEDRSNNAQSFLYSPVIVGLRPCRLVGENHLEVIKIQNML